MKNENGRWGEAAKEQMMTENSNKVEQFNSARKDIFKNEFLKILNDNKSLVTTGDGRSDDGYVIYEELFDEVVEELANLAVDMEP